MIILARHFEMKNLITLLFITILSLLFLHPISGDGDFFHHLASGRFVVNNHALPRVDEWTFTASGYPWIAYSWGMGVVFYLIYNIFGPAGISIFVALAGLLTLILLYVYLKSFGVTQKIIFLILPISAATLSIRWPSRPEIVNYPLTLSILIIDRYKDKFQRLVILIPLISLIWANFYGAGGAWALVLILLLVTKEFIKSGFKLQKSSLSFYLFCLLGIAALFFNGYSEKSIFYLSNIEKIGPMQSEWMGIIEILKSAPAELMLSLQYLLFLYFLFLFVFAVVFIFSVKKIASFSFLVLLSGSLLLPFMVFRYSSLAVVLSAPLMGVLIKEATQRKKKIFTFLLLIAGIASILISIKVNPVGISFKNDNFPTDVVSFIKKHDISGNAYQNQRIGAFLSFFLYPKVLIFVDTRDELYLPISVFSDYMNVFAKGSSVLPLLEKYKVDVVIGDFLTEGRSYEPLFYATDWAIVYINDRYFIAVRREIAKEKNLTIFDSIDPFSASGAKPGIEDKAQNEYEKAQSGDSLQNQIMMIRIFMSQKKYEEARQISENLAASGFVDNLITEITKDGILAELYLEAKDCENTKKFLTKLNNDTTNKYIFQPERKIPSGVSTGFAFYFLVCEKNYDRAKKFLDEYLSLPYVSQLERIKTIDRFQRLSIK